MSEFCKKACMFAHKIFGKCCKTQKNNFWKFFAELVLLFGKMFYNRGTKSMRTSAMQNKAHNFPPYHIGNAPRRKLRGVSLSSRISFAEALYRRAARRARNPYFSLPCVRGEQMLSWQRHGVALTICELGNAPLFGAFQGSRADAKQMRGKRSSAVSTARDGGLPKARRRGC